MRAALAGVVLFAFAAQAADVDGGTDAPLAGYHVELHEAGYTLPAPAATMPVPEAQRFDLALRTAEGDRDGYKAEIEAGGGSTTRWALISLAIGFAAGSVAAAVGICTAFGCGKKGP